MVQFTKRQREDLISAVAAVLEIFPSCNADRLAQGILSAINTQDGWGGHLEQSSTDVANIPMYNAAGDAIVVAVDMKHQGRMGDAREALTKALTMDGIEEIARTYAVVNAKAYPFIESAESEEEEEADFSTIESSISKSRRKKRKVHLVEE